MGGGDVWRLTTGLINLFRIKVCGSHCYSSETRVRLHHGVANFIFSKQNHSRFHRLQMEHYPECFYF